MPQTDRPRLDREPGRAQAVKTGEESLDPCLDYTASLLGTEKGIAELEMKLCPGPSSCGRQV